MSRKHSSKQVVPHTRGNRLSAKISSSKAARIAASAMSDAKARVKENETRKESAYFESIANVISEIEGSDAGYYIGEFGDSPLRLSQDLADKVKRLFPIPKEQAVLWVDAEFDLRPSGIALTEKGVFIKTDSKAVRIGKDALAKSMLHYYKWEQFSPDWFTSDDETNIALKTNSKHCRRFIASCQRLGKSPKQIDGVELEFQAIDNRFKAATKVGTIAGAAALAAQEAVFVEQKAEVNFANGHGEMAERAITMLDRLHGVNAIVTGGDCAKNGDDRMILLSDGSHLFVQTKYHKKWRSSLEACFDSETGLYRYSKEGKPMQLEVPKDQYRQVLDGFKIKIKQGKVPGVKDPEQAKAIVREGHLTYEQAKNLTRPGTIESLGYDALTGVVTCSCALGLSFVATMFLTWRKTKDVNEAIRVGTISGLQVFGLSFLEHMLVSQISRTGIVKALAAPSEKLVTWLGPKTTQTIVNGLRSLAGKTAISGAAATKHLAKIARSNLLTSAITLAVFSVPETYSLASSKISAAQYTKNIATLAGSIAAGAGGTVAAGVAAAKMAGMMGTTLAPGVGTAVGIVGGFVGGAIGSTAVGAIGGIIREDDAEATHRLLNAVTSSMISDYLLSDEEIDSFVAKMDKVDEGALKELFTKVFKSGQQEQEMRSFLAPIFDEVTAGRERFLLPEPKAIVTALEERVQDLPDGS